MKFQQTFVGAVVAYAVRQFDSFVGPKGETVPAGVGRSLWIVPEFSEDPLEIRVSESENMRCEGLSFGDSVRAKCSVFARDNRITLRLVEVTPDVAGKGSHGATP